MSGLRLVLLDESGEPAAQEVVGRITLSWRSGSKKANWAASEPLKLPPAKVLAATASSGKGG